MEFLSTLHADVKLLLVAGALALFAGLVSGSKKKEFQYVVLCAVLLLVAGVRYKLEQNQDAAQASAGRELTASPGRIGSTRH
jgi:hypothetical protein